MKKISDERLDKMLADYCEADAGQTFTFDPEKKREKLIPFVRFRKQFIAAASLVLVSVLSLIIYFSFGNINNTPLTVAPSGHKIITPSSTEGGGGGDPDQQDGTAPTESKSVLQRIRDFFFPDASDDTGTSSSERGGSSATVLPTEQGNGAAGRSPSRRNPSAVPSATQPSDFPPKATESGASTPITEPATEADAPPHVLPTEPIDPPWNDPEPTDPPGEGDEPWLIPPSEGGIMVGAPVEAYARFDSSLMVGVTGVYCKVYSDDSLIGSSDLYDRSHCAYILDSASGQTDVVYETPEGLINSVGKYVFVFYDQNGNELARERKYIY